MPTASSDHSPSTSQRLLLGRDRRGGRRAGPEAGVIAGAGSPPWSRLAGGHGAGLEEQRLVDLSGVTLGGDGEQLAGHDHQGAQIALGMIAEGSDHLRGHQGRGAGLLQGMAAGSPGGPAVRRVRSARRTRMRLASGRNSSVRRRSASRPSPASTTVSRMWESRSAEASRRSSASTAELHLLGLVDQQHRPGQGALDVGLPALAQDLGAAPAVVRAQLDAEEVAHLAVEVGDVGLRATDHADRHVALRRQRCSARMRKAADLPQPGAPVTRAKPPSPASCCDPPAERIRGVW